MYITVFVASRMLCPYSELLGVRSFSVLMFYNPESLCLTIKVLNANQVAITGIPRPVGRQMLPSTNLSLNFVTLPVTLVTFSALT